MCPLEDKSRPQGYRTRVGQRGRLLSSGQRQRIAIARTMIRDAPVLLLDEPTTSLDAEAGRRILAPLRRLMNGRATILISHDLRTVADAEQILYLDHGRITETGTHTTARPQRPLHPPLPPPPARGHGDLRGDRPTGAVSPSAQPPDRPVVTNSLGRVRTSGSVLFLAPIGLRGRSGVGLHRRPVGRPFASAAGDRGATVRRTLQDPSRSARPVRFYRQNTDTHICAERVDGRCEALDPGASHPG
ncbi:ATP-binding cassette domain-containing protein [Pseudonocardia sp. T1-2H]|uniref:ATP-binding cassette domain-containing protein n=1 Tax=Pseudonocardia sp. T1-2H TaxID=3128899 RepID=UPI0031019530